MAETGKTAKRNRRVQSKKNSTEIRLVETRYGFRVLIRQGENKVWLNQHHVMAILATVVGKAFEKKEIDEQQEK